MKVGLSHILQMRSVIFEASVSLDGFIEGPNGELDWLVAEEEQTFDIDAFLSSFDTIFYSRKAYEKLGIPQNIHGDLSLDETELYYTLHGIRKYVFSRKQKHVAGNGMVISENLEGEVKRIRREEGKNIWLCGGADILRTFADLDLVDEYVLRIHPVVLRSGKLLFTGNEMPLNLKLVDTQELRSGVVILHYKPKSRLKNQYVSRSL